MSDIRAINSIIVGERHRRDMGDIAELAASIAETRAPASASSSRPNGDLIAGERRLRAMQQLGWTEVPVHVVPIDDIVRGELAENTERKDFLPSEIESIRRAMACRRKRKPRRNECRKAGRWGKFPHLRRPARPATRSAPSPESPVARWRRSPRSSRRQRPNRRSTAILCRRWTRPGKVDRAYRDLVIAQKREAYAAQVEVGCTVDDLYALVAAGKRFSAIYADPPWTFKTYSDKGKQRSAERHYDTKGLDAIKALPVEQLAAKDCALFLWIIDSAMPEALEVIKAWGFTYQSFGFIWVKQNKSGEGLFTGMGYSTRKNAEVCLYATRGSPQRLAMDVPQVI